MKNFRGIEVGSNVAFYRPAGFQRIENSEHLFNGLTAFRSRKMFYTKPMAEGVVTKIHGHNKHACRIFLDNGKEIEIGLDTHFHLNGEIGDCVSHQENYSIN